MATILLTIKHDITLTVESRIGHSNSCNTVTFVVAFKIVCLDNVIIMRALSSKLWSWFMLARGPTTACQVWNMTCAAYFMSSDLPYSTDNSKLVIMYEPKVATWAELRSAFAYILIQAFLFGERWHKEAGCDDKRKIRLRYIYPLNNIWCHKNTTCQPVYITWKRRIGFKWNPLSARFGWISRQMTPKDEHSTCRAVCLYSMETSSNT